MKLHVSILSLLILLYGRCANCALNYSVELYSSSIVGLVKLLDLENQFVLHMKDYAEAQEEKLATLKTYLKTLERAQLQTEKQQKHYISNPLNEFSLLRRLRQDWPRLQNYTDKDVATESLQAMTEILDKAPDERDMNEMLKGLDRIENIYDIKPLDMSEGRLQGKEFSERLSIRDCLAMAKHKHENKDYEGAFAWYNIALRREERERNSFTYDKVLGRPLKGVRKEYARMRLLKVMTTEEPLLSDKQIRTEVDKIINETSSVFMENFVNDMLEQDYGVKRQETKLKESYHLGCRGGYPKRTNLRCYYNTTTTPFLRLAPFKMEEINLDPYIVMYHNAISDSEIEDMKRHATAFQNGLTHPPVENATEIPQIVARMQWVKNSTPFTDRMNQRVTDITGFDVHEFSELQIANYGIGGHFSPHFDYITPGRVRVEDTYGLGDRSATLIFYASDVQGGATVFPNIQVAVQPLKGSSLLWYNLFDDDSPNPRSLHTVCPVIAGSRWTLTKFIHTDPQVFKKPCRAKLAQLAQ